MSEDLKLNIFNDNVESKKKDPENVKSVQTCSYQKLNIAIVQHIPKHRGEEKPGLSHSNSVVVARAPPSGRTCALQKQQGNNAL